MYKSFWQKLKIELKTDLKDGAKGVSSGGAHVANHPRPIYVLAPMADVTDCAFRAIIAKYGRPDVTWTEFVSSDGLILANPEGKKKLLKDLEYSEAERPIVAQIFGSNPENMEKAARLVAELGFDGVDINMGCPDRSIEKQGAGAGMIKNVERAREVIEAVKRGACRIANQKFGDDPEAVAKGETIQIPVSVKTRIGYNKNELETWLPALLETNPALITVHARTRKEMSLVPADWNQVKRAVEIRNEIQKDKPENERTLIFGNGDATSITDAKEKAAASNADGVMLGRAIFGTPWLFQGLNSSLNNSAENFDSQDLVKKLNVMVEHTLLFEKLLGGTKNFAVMKKHYKAYVNGFDGAKELREHLMSVESAAEVAEIVASWTKLHKRVS